MTATALRNQEIEGVNNYKAGAAITANRLVKYTAADSDGNINIIQCAAITDMAIGVSLETVASGEMCPVQTRGIVKIEASAAVTALAQVMCEAAATGRCADAAGATALNVGIAETAAGGAGEMVQVRLGVPNMRGPVQT